MAASGRIPLKKSAAGRFGLRSGMERAASLAAQAVAGLVIGIIFAIFRRFWAAAARWNSSLAPLGPRRRRRSSFRMRFRWAKSISTFFRWRRDTRYASVVAISRARSRAPSWTDRVTLRAGHVGRAPLAQVTILAVLLTRPIADRSVLIDTAARSAEVAMGPPQAVACRADVAVVFMVIDEVGPLEAAIVPGRLVEHGNVRFDALVLDQPSQVGS